MPGPEDGEGQTPIATYGHRLAERLGTSVLARVRDLVGPALKLPLDQLDKDIVSRVDQLDQDIVMRLEALESLVRKLHADDWSAANDRHRAMYDLLSSHNQVTWDTDRQLNDTVMRRLGAIEQAVRAHLGPPTEASPGNATRLATQLSDFLGVALPEDPEPVTLRTGTVEVELPAWDTVILPWLREHGEWEPAVGEMLESTAAPGWVVLDIGAHVGIFTVALASLVGPQGRVVAVEADPVNARFLRRNIVRAERANVMVLEMAAWDQTGTVRLSRSTDDNTGDSRSYDVATAGQVLDVPAIALDEVVVGPVHLVKIDLQGTDHIAMRGMSRIIAEHRPIIITEFWPAAIRDYGDDPIEVLNWFRELGYSWRALEDGVVTDEMPDTEICSSTETSSTGFFNLVLRARSV